MKKITSMILALVFAVSLIGSASAKTLKIQLTFPKTSYDGQIVKMWTDRVTKLTRGELKFELLSAGEVVGMKETLEAVDKGLVDGGAAWTHYWSNYHPAGYVLHYTKLYYMMPNYIVHYTILECCYNTY